MGLDWRCSWTREEREQAEREGKTLVAFAVNGPAVGRMEFRGSIGSALASGLFLFAHKVIHGTPPEEALAEFSKPTEAR